MSQTHVEVSAPTDAPPEKVKPPCSRRIYREELNLLADQIRS